MIDLVPVHTFAIDSEQNLISIISNFSVNKVMIIRNDDSECTDKKFHDFISRLQDLFPNLDIECDLCICGSNAGHCRVYNNGAYDPELTVKRFLGKLEKFRSYNIRSVILSDMNLDTIAAVCNEIGGKSMTVSAEIKLQTDMYNAYRLKSGMPRLVKEYHIQQGDYQFIAEYVRFTNHLILKPASLMNPVLQFIHKNYPDVKCSVFITTAEGKMAEYLYNEYKIDFLKELLVQYELLDISSIYLPENVLMFSNNEEMKN